MNQLWKQKKEEVRNELKNSSWDWSLLLSKYDEEILDNEKQVEDLKNAVDNFKENESIKKSILYEIEAKEWNLKIIKSSKENLLNYLEIKKIQIQKLIDRSSLQEENKNKNTEKLDLDIAWLTLSMEKLKENYDAMSSFPKIQETIKIEIEKNNVELNNKIQELSTWSISKSLSTVLLDKVNNAWWQELLSKNFLFNKFELKRKNEYAYCFIDQNGEEILKIEDLWLDINRHGSYFVKKINENLIDIVSNESHYVYDLKNMKILWQTDHNVNIIKSNWTEYIALRDKDTFAADTEYNVFDLKTWDKIFDKKVKWLPMWIWKVWDKDVIYTNIYLGNETRIYFYSKDNWDVLWSKLWNVGDKIIFNTDDLSQIPLNTDDFDFIKGVSSFDSMFFIVGWYNSNSVKILNSQNFEEIGTFSSKSGFVKMEDGSIIALKSIENSNNWIIFDLNNKEDLSSNYCKALSRIKDFDEYSVFEKVNGDNMILNKWKGIVDCMWKVVSDKIPWTSLVLVEQEKNGTKKNNLIDTFASKILSIKDKPGYSIDNVFVFRSDKISSNVILRLKDKNNNTVYSYSNLASSVNKNWEITIDKTYNKVEKSWSESILSNWIFWKVRIDWYWNKI